ncbi:WD40 repeat domain-containing protein pink isoform X2 [Dermacentor variabilis]|uniref:WD40 repeat domain-containing protein pink isoform X2 n=1 Tax=Dermacentor variabilis TaxID=34621 RepID=UPI003F5B99CC
MAEGGAELTSQAPFVLAEYQSLDGILAPIRNLTRVKYACFDASKRYLAFGATTGDVFMFHRDTTAYITTITNKEGAVSQVALAPDDFVLGVATSRGHVVVLEHNARKPAVQAQRLQLSFEHKGSVVTCLEWNSVGTRLFAADNTGKVSILNVSTSKAKSLFQSPPSTLMRLDSKVVQLNFAQDRLLASTLTRCYLGDTIREKFTQVGKKLRDGEFGGCFYPGSKPQDSMCIYAARPGSRIWQADLKGSVLKTHQFKEALAINPVKLVTYRSDTSILGSTASSASTTAFTKLLTVWASSHNLPYLISWSSNGLYVIDPQAGEIVLWNDELKDVKDLRCVRNNIYIQLHSGEFCACCLLTPVQAVLCLLQHNYATLCGQFLCQNQLLIPKPAFEKTLSSELCFELHDKLQEAGQVSLAMSVAKVLLDSYDVDITNKPAKPKVDLAKEECLDPASSNLAHVSVERAPTKRRSREAQKSKDELGVSSPRHVRCHSSEPVKTHLVSSPRPVRKTVRRGSDPPPLGTLDKIPSAESFLKLKPTKACSPRPARRTVGLSSGQRERSLSLDAPRQVTHESQPSRTLSERPRQLPTVAKSSAFVGLSVGSRDQNKETTKVGSSNSSGRETPEDSEVSPTPGCSVAERGNNKKAYGSALRILPAIPASPLDSPMSPLDRVDPEVLASMYAEQDVGYESVYQYLSLGVYGSSLVPAAFTMRGTDLAQLANVADLAKLRDTLSSRLSNGKDSILKNLRGLENKLKYFSVDQAADVGLPSPLSVVPECTPAEPNVKPAENFSKHLTPKDEFWSFLPGVNSSFIEATLQARLHEVAQEKLEDTFTKKASCLSARDILYFTQLCKVESFFLGAMQGALSCFTLPQMLSSFRKYLENEEVRWEWVTQCLQSVNNECLKCSCGAPSYNSHKTNWPMYEHLKAVLCNKDWISQKSLELCRTYAFWPGYLCALKHLGHRTEHLVNVIQLGDAELLMPDHFLGFVPESPQEWKLAMELVGRHRTEKVVMVTCLSCGKPHKSTESQMPLTVQSVAQRMLASLGFEQAAAVLHELNLPRNSLGQGFYLASVLLTLIEQQQAALSHRMLSRLESYVWSRRPVTLPPQVADVLDREKQGLAGHDELTDVQLQGSFVEEPESHWGGNIPLLSNCFLCGLPLGTTVSTHVVVMCHCGHCFHESCLPSPGDFCVICKEEHIWKR